MLHVQIFIAITLWIITTAYLLIKLNNRKIFLDILNKNHEDLILENESLRVKEYNYIVLVEKLKAQVEFLEKDALNSEKNKKDAFITAQTSFNQVSQNLTKQLLEMQKQESKANLTMTEQVITSTVNRVKADFEKITAAMSILNSDIENSNKTHDAIKKSLLSPIATGQLAEITLVNILTSAGLKQNTDFFVQNTLLSDENNKLRPDVIFTMPDHVLIIDAKSSKFFMDF
jgi:DNA recombination protein RmuC